MRDAVNLLEMKVPGSKSRYLLLKPDWFDGAKGKYTTYQIDGTYANTKAWSTSSDGASWSKSGMMWNKGVSGVDVQSVRASAEGSCPQPKRCFKVQSYSQDKAMLEE